MGNKESIESKLDLTSKQINMALSEFKYFPNDLSLFQICEKYFPVTNRMELFNKDLVLSIDPDRCISMKIKEIRKIYQDIEHEASNLVEISRVYPGLNYKRFYEQELQQEGYMHMVRGRDLDSFLLQLGFIDYKGGLPKIDNIDLHHAGFRQAVSQIEFFEIDSQILSEIGIQMEMDKKSNIMHPGSVELKTFEKYLERRFFSFYCEGVNDAKFEGYLLDLQKELSNITKPLQQNNSKANQKNLTGQAKNEYPKFESLFYNEAEIGLCIEALREVDPPIVDEQNRYLLGKKLKGAFAAWISVLWTKNYIKTGTGNKIAPLLNKKFSGLDLYSDGQSLGKKDTKGYETYINGLTQLIPKRLIKP